MVKIMINMMQRDIWGGSIEHTVEMQRLVGLKSAKRIKLHKGGKECRESKKQQKGCLAKTIGQ